MLLTTAPSLHSHVAVSIAQLASGKHHRRVDQLKRNHHLGRLRQRCRGCVKLVDCCSGEFILNSQLIMVFLLLILCLTPEVISSERCNGSSPIVMHPSTVTLEDKSALQLNCTILPDFRDKYNAKDIYFTKNLLNYTSTHLYFKLVSDYQANLSIPLAHYEDFKGHIRCWMAGLDGSCRYSWLKSTTTDVTFRRSPLKPSFNSCVVENWERLKCVWSPTRETQLNYTLTTGATKSFFYRFVYSKVSDNTEGPQHEYSNKTKLNDTCILYADKENNSFQMGSVYELFIHAMIDTGHQKITTWKEQFGEYFNTNEHVKPNPVMDLKVDPATGLLSWKRPSSTWSGAGTWSFIYNVTYRTNWNKNATTFIISENMINLSVPYTKYQVSVSVKPTNNGNWSDLSSLNWETKAAAPVVNPEISVVGYEYDPDCTGHCKALIYWQPIKASEQYAANLQYVVLQRTESQRLKRQIYHDPDANRITKTLPKEDPGGWFVVKNVTGYNHSFAEINVTSDMEITVITQNDVGVNKHTERSIFIMKKEHLLPATEQLVIEGYSNASTNISVSFEDLPSEINSTSYVLFWADKNNEKLVNWQALPTENGTFTWNVSLKTDYTACKYGLGKIQNQANSGIRWSDEPTYVYEGLAPPPIYIKVSSISSSCVTLNWNMPPVEHGDGHIMYFLIQYYSWDNSTNRSTEDHVKHKQVPGTLRSVTLTKLSRSTQYMVEIISVTRSGNSRSSKIIYVTTSFGLTAGHITGIVIAAIIMVIILGAAVYIWCKRFKQARKFHNSGVKVQLPDKKDYAQNSELGADSVSCETPFLPTMFQQDGDTYNRSISINSMDSGLSLDDGMYHEEMYSYARTGYISPTPLRSIPEDADMDEVSLTGMDSNNGEGFIQTYKVTPGQPSSGYLSNNTTGSSLPSHGHDPSRSAISRYAAVTLDEQSEAEQPVEKCTSVAFVTGQGVVRLGSDERTPSPESGCTYTQIQTDPKVTKKSQNPFSYAFFSANRAKVNNPIQSTCSGCVLDSGKTRKIPRYGKHWHYDGSFKRKAAVSGVAPTLSKRPTEYMANDGTFNSSAAPKVPPGYVANDGTFNPSAGGDPVSAYVANDGTFDPSVASKSASNDPSDYVPNDGSFDPTTASKLPNGYVPNDGSFDPSTASYPPSDYVPNDGSFDPKTTSHLSSDYVPNDGSFDPKAASDHQNDYVANDGSHDPKTASDLQSNYVPNDGSFDPKTALQLSSDYVPNDGSFDPKTASHLSSDYVPNDGSFDPKTASNLQSDYVPNDGSFNPSAVSEDVSPLTELTASNVQCPKLPGSKNRLSEGFFPDTKLYDSTTKLHELNCNDSTDTVLSADYNSGYVPHDVTFTFGSVNSLNHRLSAVDTDHVDDDCFDDVEPRKQELDSQASNGMRPPDSDACLNESSPSSSCQGCSVVQTADKHIPQQQNVGDAHEKPAARLRSKPGRSNQVTLSSLDATALARDAALLEHRKSAPGYVNVQPNMHTAPNCNVPTTLASVSRQCGGFVREVRPSPDPEHVGNMPHGDLDDTQTSGKQNQQESLSLDAEGDAKQNGTPGVVFAKNVNNGTLPNNELSQDNVNSVRGDVRKQNGVIPSQTNGIVKRCAAMDSVGDMPNGAALCGSPSSKDRHSYGEGEMASRNENNNITKSDYCRPSVIVNSNGMPASAEAGNYVQAPLV